MLLTSRQATNIYNYDSAIKETEEEIAVGSISVGNRQLFTRKSGRY